MLITVWWTAIETVVSNCLCSVGYFHVAMIIGNVVMRYIIILYFDFGWFIQIWSILSYVSLALSIFVVAIQHKSFGHQICWSWRRGRGQMKWWRRIRWREEKERGKVKYKRVFKHNSYLTVSHAFKIPFSFDARNLEKRNLEKKNLIGGKNNHIFKVDNIIPPLWGDVFVWHIWSTQNFWRLKTTVILLVAPW